AQSQSVTDGTSNTVSHTNGKTRSDWDIKRGIAQATTGAASVAVAAGSASGGMGAPAGALMGGLIGLGVGILGGSKSESDTVSNATNHSNTTGATETNSNSTANSSTETNTDTNTKGEGKSYQYTIKNRRIKELLEIIDEQLKRIRNCKNYGMWKWGTYFISDNRLTVKMGADIYSGILKGKATGLEQSAVTLWDKNKNEQRYNKIIDHIVRLRHPILKMPEGYSFSTTLPTSLISTEEVAVAMNLPQKSLPGIPVFESVEFGRSVSSYKSANSSKEMSIGAISYLGRESKNHIVKIDINSLTAHTFITGSTGAGKSNSIYYMLNNLWQNHKIPFLIIEPAKGEYKEIFGGIQGVSVYGTNPYLAPVLRINPFSFPENIHITEHIDRFIEILNAVWPMYAAMPAILKEGIEIAYEKMGWNLLTSKNIYGHVFPDFHDLMEHLPGIIEKSSYSDEVKGNYAGALLTRVRSLTNGYFKSIFQKEEIENNELFDLPCIVDLSRIGSSETKALLMGILFQKLNEYRISSKKGINSELQHITVLEEAHNLLRRTSFEQNQEGNNLQGKSVEMISNSIAEMRTYGEGFIIADQAPGLLDQSVIRNTNTKIILRLPDYDDRQLTGKAASLNNEQIEELAKLKTGCAAVYQNDWQEAVLCQFEQFDSDLAKPFKHNKGTIIEFDKREHYHTELLNILIDIYFSDKNIDEVAKGKNIDLIKISNYYPGIIQSIKSNGKSNRSLIENFRQLIDLDSLLDKTEKNDDIDIWTESVLNELFKNNIHKSLDSENKEGLVQILFDSLALIKPEDKDLWEDKKKDIDNWRKHLC
ncbi:MAG: ATP-binding protein, partial [Deltaproteobacteria bacterium]|nr:ATP-binding protein [Deltaproteobacteria bacterium]